MRAMSDAVPSQSPSPTLPIDTLRMDFDQALCQGHVVVEASTGSGKSTRLPLWCASHGAVLVIEPRRLACRALATHVRTLAPEGVSVGYAVRFDTASAEKAAIVFATPGIVLRWLADGTIQRFHSIILDEFHERRWDTDLILALLVNAGHQHLILTSATVEGERLARYLNARRLCAEGRQFPVTVSYREERELPRSKHLDKRLLECIQELLPNLSTQGDILVFLPGKGEIQSAYDLLRSRLDLEIIPLHAGVSNAQQDAALQRTDCLRIILATNVAETSITIPGVVAVIDSGLERRSHHRNGRTVLGLHTISQAAAEQRRGRAGRLGPGVCVRLWGRQIKLEPFTPPEVVREELTELMLAAAAAGHPAQQLRFVDPLPEHAYNRALKFLQQMQAVDAHGLITEHGRRLFPLPLDPQFAHLITAMPDDDSRSAMIDLASALSVDRPLLGKIDKEDQIEAFNRLSPLQCDALALIKLMRQGNAPGLPVNGNSLKEARQISRQVHSALRLEPIKREFQRDNLLRAVIRAQPDLVFVRREKRPQALGNGDSEVEIGRESRFPEQAQAALVFDQHSIPGKGTLRTINIALCMAPVPFSFLAELELGEARLSQPQWQDNDLLCLQERHYAGRVIDSREIQPQGASAREALGRLILRGSLLAPAGECLQSDIQAWNLFLYLKLAEGEVAEVEGWLQKRLKELGVEQGRDILLIEVQDLRFDGIPEWQRAEFDQRYPRRLQLENLRVNVDYDLSKRRITLTKTDGHRRTPPMSKELPLWSGWQVEYRDGSKLISVR